MEVPNVDDPRDFDCCFGSAKLLGMLARLLLLYCLVDCSGLVQILPDPKLISCIRIFVRRQGKKLPSVNMGCYKSTNDELGLTLPPNQGTGD